MTLEKKLSYALKTKKSEELDETFKQIFNSYYKLVYFVSYQYVLNDADSEDICQEVFINFFNTILKNDICYQIKNIKQYLCTMAKNKSLDFLKINKSNLPLQEEIASYYDQYELFDDNFLNIWNKCLTSDEQHILIDHILIGESLKDIAIKKNVPYNTIKSVYHRSIKKLKERIKNEEK